MLSFKQALAAALLAAGLAAQPAPVKPQFEVASVKPNKTDATPRANNPLGPGNVYSPYGGYFQASNFPLYTYILFAYKIMGNQEQFLRTQIPAWVMSDRFDIEARAEGNPDKDQMRLMMRSLLAERFRLAIHYETRQAPVFALILSRPGKTGTMLLPHPEDYPCSIVPGASKSQADGQFPALCSGLFPLPPGAPGRQHIGARRVPMAFIANSLSALGQLERPVIDRTGLSGDFDFALEWVPERGADPDPDQSGPTFLGALKDQLGIKLESQKGPSEFIILDHVEHPSEN